MRFLFLVVLAISSTAFAEVEENNTESQSYSTLSEVFPATNQSWLGKQWEKLAIKIPIKAGENFDVTDHVSLGLTLAYRYESRPGFYKNFHQRLDSYLAMMRGSLSDGAFIGGGLDAQITFSRVFPDKNASVFAKPYFLKQIPLNANAAVKGLNPGDAIRVEIASDGSLGYGWAELLTKTHFDFNQFFSLGYSRGTRLITEVYRLKDNRVRLRFIAVKNSATFGVTAGVNLLPDFDSGASIIDKRLKKLLRCSPFVFAGSTTITGKTPVDTLMADYIINLNAIEGAQVFDDLMGKLFKLKFIKYLNLGTKTHTIGEAMLALVKPADDLFALEREAPAPLRKIDRAFKGRTLADMHAEGIGSNCSRIWDLGWARRHAETNVRSYDQFDVPSDHIYLSSVVEKESGVLFNLYAESERLAVNSLFKSIRKDNMNTITIEPIGLTDLILTRDFTDKDLRKGEMGDFKSELAYLAPNIASKIDWTDFTPNKGSTYTNAYIRTRWVFNPEILAMIDFYSEEDVYKMVRKYVDNFPNKIYLPKENRNDHLRQEYDDEYEMDVQYIAKRVYRLLAEPTVKARYKAFDELHSNGMFQIIGAGFILSLIPESRHEDAVGFVLNAGSTGQGALTFNYGKPKVSELYASVEYILATLERRVFDLRLQLNESGIYRDYQP